MAFVLKKEASYFWPVSFNVASNGGVYEKQVLDVEFKRLPQSTMTELLRRDNATDVDFCREVVIGWKGVTDEHGNELPFSVHAKNDLLEVPALASAIVKAYLESVAGAKAKN